MDAGAEGKGEVMSDKPKSWERRELEREGREAFAAFAMYRDMGVERSTEKVAKQLSKSVSLIRRWSAQWNWVERAGDWDAYLDQQNRAIAEGEHMRALADFRGTMVESAQRRRRLADRLIDRIEQRLDAEDADPSEGTLAALARAAAALSETAQNAEAMALGIDDLTRRLGAKE